MARPKEFDRDEALDKAIEVFSRFGYEGSSTDVLLDGMGISRQSMYNTFGDKRRLYLEALRRYTSGSVADLVRAMGAGSSPLGGLEKTLLAFASRPHDEASLGCLGVSAICEFGTSDRDVVSLGETSGAVLGSAIERVIVQARQAGEVAADIDPRQAAEFIAMMLAGLKVAARGGATPEALRRSVRMALRSLK